ncbi:transporter substrate-binding domain-containing protein [Enterococcus dongliensis]|uniref:Transporter substrate-binding domain-containing protein n=1 Tax=Enterococcus dongliensis TaxID=2559925 RepID=A0AAW8TKT8_9ENTE|nr:transporter substrate-binding domain-containing protein [Enterococcus dongliensis]MDT2597496.1 transporter substrate-binding domain-containing protein [Enterococcus dongliensis]MDT2603060.1 transporter substrate-binding domain-containing protein [Enterococcus dongliensis]MDT2633404.1 transporter substrate-binding domain-containing protein [Enterococcus dongliensis]MDT2636755.1 transporter substrate-binding domain-containing protein [Enterococcus dongliensis]MDT2638874.1 transporter substrat
MKKGMKVVLAGLALVVLTACGNKEEADKLDTIKEKGVIKVATSPDYAPFGFHTTIDGKDKIVGADIEMTEAIAKKMNVKVDWVDMSFNAVLAAAKEGKADIAVSAISATSEREKSFDFTTDYYTTPQVIVINKQNADTLTSIDQFTNKQVGAQKGTIQENIVKDQLKKAKLVSIEKLPNIFVEVKNGSLDGLVVEKTVADAYVNKNPELMIANVPLKSMKEDSLRIAVPKGNKKLVKELNKQINELKEAGAIEKMVKANNQLK